MDLSVKCIFIQKNKGHQNVLRGAFSGNKILIFFFLHEKSFLMKYCMLYDLFSIKKIFRFSIKPITDENVYVFNARAMVCLDGGKCSINIPVLTNTKLPSIRAVITGDFSKFVNNLSRIYVNVQPSCTDFLN